VVPNAWYAQVDEHGRYRIEGIEPGEHILEVWSPALEEGRIVQVALTPGASTQVDFYDVKRVGNDAPPP
jgi:hypothetical protein